jgi:hypothetical protein
LLQVQRVKALGEPTVHRSEKFSGLLRLPLIAPQPRHAHGCAQLERFCPLRARKFESLNKAYFRFLSGSFEEQSEFTLNSEHVGVPEIFACFGYPLLGISDRAQAILRITSACLQIARREW